MMDDESREKYLKKYDTIGEKIMTQVERMVYLRSIDTMWIEHLNAMDLMREGIGLQGYGQRDPLVEYKAAAYRLFQKLNQEIHGQIVDILLKAEITPTESRELEQMSVEQPRTIQTQGADESMAAGTFENSRNSQEQISEPMSTSRVDDEVVSRKNDVEVTVRHKSDSTPSESSSSSSAFDKVGRNDPCPCGAKHEDGRPIKYKHCHGK